MPSLPNTCWLSKLWHELVLELLKPWYLAPVSPKPVPEAHSTVQKVVYENILIGIVKTLWGNYLGALSCTRDTISELHTVYSRCLWTLTGDWVGDLLWIHNILSMEFWTVLLVDDLIIQTFSPMWKEPLPMDLGHPLQISVNFLVQYSSLKLLLATNIQPFCLLLKVPLISCCDFVSQNGKFVVFSVWSVTQEVIVRQLIPSL